MGQSSAIMKSIKSKDKSKDKKVNRKKRGGAGVSESEDNYHIPTLGLADSYKVSHQLMYVDAKLLVAYGECRGPHKLLSFKKENRLICYGIRYIIDRYINNLITDKDIESIKDFYKLQGVSSKDGTNVAYPFNSSIIDELKGKYPPIKIYGLEEGTVMLPHTPVYMIVCDDPKFSGMVTFFETLLTMVWYPISVATLSRVSRDLFEQAYDKCGLIEDRIFARYQLLDFGFRGSSSVETSIIGGMAHLLNGEGSDTMSASFIGQNVYNNNIPISGTVPASEHSVMTSYQYEVDAMLNILLTFGGNMNKDQRVDVIDNNIKISIPTGAMSTPLSIVMDSYDYENSLLKVLPAAIQKFIDLRKSKPELKKSIFIDHTFEDSNQNTMNNIFKFQRNNNPLISYEDQRYLPENFGIVFRPDSGNPTLAVLQGLIAGVHIFGVEKNTLVKNRLGKPPITYIKPRYVRVLQADGISINTISDLLDAITNPASIGSSTIAFNPISILCGMGGGLLQKVDRGTTDFATKLSYVEYDTSKPEYLQYNKSTKPNKYKIVMKDPATDSDKRSLPGILTVVRNNNGIPITNRFRTEEEQNSIKNLISTTLKEYDITEGGRRKGKKIGGDKMNGYPENMLKLLYSCDSIEGSRPTGLYAYPIKNTKNYFNDLKAKVDKEWDDSNNWSKNINDARSDEIKKAQEWVANNVTRNAQNIDGIGLSYGIYTDNNKRTFNEFTNFTFNNIISRKIKEETMQHFKLTKRPTPFQLYKNDNFRTSIGDYNRKVKEINGLKYVDIEKEFASAAPREVLHLGTPTIGLNRVRPAGGKSLRRPKSAYN